MIKVINSGRLYIDTKKNKDKVLVVNHIHETDWGEELQYINYCYLDLPYEVNEIAYGYALSIWEEI